MPVSFAFVLLTLPDEFTYPMLFELFVQRLAERSHTLRACTAYPRGARRRLSASCHRLTRSFVLQAISDHFGSFCRDAGKTS